MFPPTNPDAGLLASVRAALAAADFTEATVRERSGVTSLHEFHLGEPLPDAPPPHDAAEALIRLFMVGSALPRERVRALLGPILADGLVALEMLAADPQDAQVVLATVALYPIEGLYIASDRGDEFPFGRLDSVFPAINPAEPAYLAALPRTPCESFLEVCAGTGIAALIAARNAGHVWASDVAERSTLFARFNAALNGIENFTAVQGDMYAPVAGHRFERIVAHPPYVPAVEQREIYRDGGLDGEALTRRVIAEAPEHLLPGGRLYCTCTMTERADEALEARVRRMLGAAADEFDVLVAVAGALPPIVHFTREHLLGRHTLQEMATLVRSFEELKIADFCPCTVVLQKHQAAGPPLTLRREGRGQGDAAAAIDRILRWESFGREPAALDRLAGARPRLSSQARLQVTHAPGEGGWKMEACRILVGGALPAQLDASSNAAVFLGWCDGTSTVDQLARRLMEEGLAPPEQPLRALAGLVLPLLKEGVLEAELPPA